jgi:hypothetical protein
MVQAEQNNEAAVPLTPDLQKFNRHIFQRRNLHGSKKVAVP